MLIDYVIPNARTLDQLNEPTVDHLPDENARLNCVAASIAEGLNTLLEPGGAQRYLGDAIKDDVYGQGFTGFQGAAAYVRYCAQHGVTMTPYRSTSQANLIAMLRHEVRQGHPVIVTMPSEWSVAPADPQHPSGYTHVGLAVGIGGTTGLAGAAIRVMNPWRGFMQDQPDEWWQARLCEGEIWIMERTPVAVAPAPKPVAAPIPAPIIPVAAPKPVTAPPVAAPAPQPVSVPPTPTAPPDAPVSAPPPTPQPAPPAPKEATSMQNPFSIFARAAANIRLTPGERAFLKLAKGVLFTGVVAALGVAMPLISSGHATLNSATIQAIIGAGAVAGLSALEKLFSAQGDAAANASAPTPPAA